MASSKPLSSSAHAKQPIVSVQSEMGKAVDTDSLTEEVLAPRHDSQLSSKNFLGVRPHLGWNVMSNTRSDRSELTSINQIVHEIIDGGVRRHTFTQWELELLLDLQTCRIRKSSRPEVLRRYLKAVQQHFATGALDPLRLATFLEQENQRSRTSLEPWAHPAAAARETAKSAAE